MHSDSPRLLRVSRGSTFMKQASQRGAARVSAMWLIVFVVMFLVALGIAFTQGQEAAIARETAASARSEAAGATAKESEVYDKSLSITQVLGFYDRETQNALTDAELAAGGIDKLRAVFTLPASATDFESVIDPIIEEYQAKLALIRANDATKTDLESQLATARSTVASVTASKDQEIQKLTSELDDERNNRATEQQDYESRIAQLTANRNSIDQELKGLQGQLFEANRQREIESQEHTTRMNHVMAATRFLREPETADGEVLAISGSLGIGWINIGASQRVSRGMEFRIESGKPGLEGHVKGYGRVIEVDEDTAKVLLHNLTDPHDLVAAGDKIFNPLFDATAERNAVLLGRFSGLYNEKELRMLLDGINIKVQDQVDRETDYLIVGAEIYEDENGEPLEEPRQPSEEPVYKQAEADGVQIVPIRDVVRYFKK